MNNDNPTAMERGDEQNRPAENDNTQAADEAAAVRWLDQILRLERETALRVAAGIIAYIADGASSPLGLYRCTFGDGKRTMGLIWGLDGVADCLQAVADSIGQNMVERGTARYEVREGRGETIGTILAPKE